MREITELLNKEEQLMFNEMLFRWGELIAKNQTLSDYYNGKIATKNLGIAIPPKLASKLKNCGMQWCKQAVKRVADISVIEGFNFAGDAPEGFIEAMNENEFIDQYDETVPSQLQHGPSFWTVTAGDTKKGEPPFIIASYDALHATALYDYRHRRVLCGLTIVDVDVENPLTPTAVNFYSPTGDIVELYVTNDGWKGKRVKANMGRCLMEVMRHDPDKQHPFGNTAITPSILTLEEQANAAFVRLVCTSEYAASLQKYILGADDDIFEGDRWKAHINSIIALPSIDEDGEHLPQIGQFPQVDTAPQVKTIREMASLFAAEASIPIHSLLYTEANPASAEAIEASRYDLVQKARKLNRLNAHSIRNIALMALAIQLQKPINELDEVAHSFGVQWKNPLTTSLAGSADAATKIASEVPGFAGTTTYWQMLGFDARQAEIIQAEVAKNLATADAAGQSIGFNA